ncbi:MAG: YHS domain-containing protein [Planctomycetes bacterium]|nr:YHS domain-containing protein [Planctomycetota bacterium]
MRRLAALVAAVVPGFAASAQDKVDFDKQIAPIFVQRCIECHGPDKDKGDLRLDQRAFAFPEGDEDNWTILAGKPDESELIVRVKLPLGDEDIMPEKGEPLTDAQKELLTRWVAEGAEWTAAGDKVIADALAAKVLPQIAFELPPLDAAAQASIDTAAEALRAKGAVVQRVAADTEALDVNLSLLRDKIGDDDLALLEPLAPRLVWLNLSRTSVSDAGASHLQKLTQLRRLHAANTAIGDATVAALSGHTWLEYVNLYGTQVTDAALPHLQGLTRLKKLYVWQTGVTAEGAAALHGHLASVVIDLGDYAEERMAAAEREIAEREAKKAAEEAAKKAAEEAAATAAAAAATAQQAINDTCPVSGKPVDPAFFVDHEGRRIAFCCGKCKAAFEQEPAKYLGKLPKVETPAPAATAAINDTCPVSGKPVDPACFVDHDGRRIAFCCGKCKAAFEKEPAKYLDKLPKVETPAPAATAAINDICPVSGKAVDPACFVDHEGRRIAFCCGKCKAAFEKEPAKYADKLPKK